MRTVLTIIFCLLILSETAPAAILWVGGEDIDFPNGSAPCVTTGASYFRSGYAREALFACTGNNISKSTLFPGGAVTSAWLSMQLYFNAGVAGKYIGLAKSGTNSSLWVGVDAAGKLTLWKYDDTTWTSLVVQGSTTLTTGMNKLDMQVISYGASATVNVYLNAGTSTTLTYTGNVVAGTASNLDSVVLSSGITNATYGAISEIIVADVDTRYLSLATLAPNANGTTNAWAGTYTSVYPTTINDASYISTTASSNDFQCNLSALPAGNFSILGVKINARMITSGAGPTSTAVGVYTNATVNVPAATSLPTAWGQVETYYTSTNPVTTVDWTTSDINALQINLRSAP